MDNFRQSQQSGSAAPSMRGHLDRSFPSSHSIASTASPGMSTPNSWSANEWLRGTPDTSPPSSGVGSPQLKAKLPSDDGSVSPVEESIDPTSAPAAKNVCFIGAGFVGMVEPIVLLTCRMS
jgi:UDPglucose 6-dehydrogenase